MASSVEAQRPIPSSAGSRHSWAVLLAIAGGIALLHLLTNGRYGFHRDELQVLSDARHLDWGFVPYPPLTPFLEHIGLSFFGLSLVGLRLFSVLAQAIALVVVGRMARDLGGGTLAQGVAALSVALSPLPLFNGTEFQYTSFDFLWWVLVGWAAIRLLTTEDPRYWLAIGAAVGLGLLTKYSMVFLIAGILAGVALSSARRFLLTKWFWAGVALAFLLCLPNLIWQIGHGFVSYRFLHSIHLRDVGQGRTDHFLRDQALICVNLAAVPLVLSGLVACVRTRGYRMLAWMFVVPFLLFFLGKGRGYYMAAGYPLLIAVGAVVAERWLANQILPLRRAVQAAYIACLAGVGAYICAVLIPLQSNGPLRAFALERNGDLREEFGWNEMVRSVAAVRDALPADRQASLGVIVGNYGEQGAIELFGPAYRLPPPISMTNSAWLRGYSSPAPSTLIVAGFSREQANRDFTACQLAGHNGNSEGIRNEESLYHPDIFVCGAPRLGWPVFWQQNQRFG